MNRTIKRKMLRAKQALNHTIQKILDINRKKKQMIHLENALHRQQDLNEELRMLNKMAEHHARIVQHYQNILNHRG